MTGAWYTLDEHGSPVPASGLEEWVAWAAEHGRHIAYDVVGDTAVSTIFLGIDHSFGFGEPLLFETMITGGACHGHQERHARRIDAIAAHAAAVARARSYKSRRLTFSCSLALTLTGR